MQTVNELLNDARQALNRYGYFQQMNILNRGNGLIKFRLIIAQNLFVQVNRSEQTSVTNFALIHNAQRIYGRDEYRNQWHQHAAAAPQRHNRDQEGIKPVTLTVFLEEVDALLHEKNLI